MCSLNMKNHTDISNVRNNQELTALMSDLYLGECRVTTELTASISDLSLGESRVTTELTASISDLSLGECRVTTELTASISDLSLGECRVTTELIDNGADANNTDVNGNKALHVAVSSPVSGSHLAVLIYAGCEVNHQNNEGLSPLMLAGSQCSYPAVAVLLDAGADVNAVSHDDSSKTALSYLPELYYLRNEDICGVETLLNKGANASYLSPCLLSTIICQHLHELIPKLIRCGLAPLDINFDDMLLRPVHRAKLTSLSPLCLALMVGNVTIARYFWENQFLTNFDVTSLASNKIVRRVLESQRYQKCLNLLDQICSQPMSLFGTCFVAASSAVGASPGREARVNELPLPRVVKDKLLFKSEVARLPRPEDRDDNIHLPFGVTSLVYLSDYFSTARHLDPEE